ncbi:MAG: cupin domain-containing protein [Vicinamibacterales bacterium]
MSHLEPAAIDWAVLPETVVHGRIRKRTFTTDRFTVVRYDFPDGAVFPWHAHPESQATIVLAGTFTFDFGSYQRDYIEGQVIVIPGGVGHEGRAEHGPADIVCVLTPPRAEG